MAIIPVILVLLAGSPCVAQNDHRLPDSLNTEVDNISTVTLASPEDSSQADRGSAREDSSQRNNGASSDSGAVTPADTPTLRGVPGPVIAALKKEKDYEYANDPAYWARKKPRPPSGFWAFLGRLARSDAFRFILYALLGGLLVFALYKIIAGNNLHHFYRSLQKIREGAEPADGMELDEEDLEKKIRESLVAGDQRMATRWLFLKALRLLKDRGLINYHAQGTNQEYAGQLSGHPQGKNFRFLSDAYEHIWYGNFLLNEGQSVRLIKYFQDFYKEIEKK